MRPTVVGIRTVCPAEGCTARAPRRAPTTAHTDLTGAPTGPTACPPPQEGNRPRRPGTLPQPVDRHGTAQRPITPDPPGTTRPHESHTGGTHRTRSAGRTESRTRGRGDTPRRQTGQHHAHRRRTYRPDRLR